MGRVSKFLTEEERREARRKAKQDYSQTVQAKDLRRQQNHRAYQRRTAGRCQSELTPTWPTIPRRLRQQAASSLPIHSHFFKLEFRSREEPSASDALAHWDYFPPYSPLIEGPGSIAPGGVHALVKRLHGRRALQQRLYEQKRLGQLSTLTDNELLCEIDSALNTHLEAWQDLKEVLATLPALPTVNHTFGRHLQLWKARQTMALLEDWRAAKRGRDAFRVHYTLRWDKYI